MADIHHYERVLSAKKPSMRAFVRVLLVVYYTVLTVIGVILALNSNIGSALLLLVALVVMSVVILTWKYSSVEYEYSFYAGVFTFSKIYGRSRRRTCFECELSTLTRVLPYSKENADRLTVSSFENAIPSTDSVSLPCICVFESEGRVDCAVIDCDEMTLKILKYYKPSAIDKSVYDAQKRT